MIKYIFCDLDGTLYRNNTVSKEDVDAIKKVQSKGIMFSVATGRTLNNAKEALKESVDINGYFICENGSFIFDKDGEMVKKTTIEDNLVKKIISRFNSENSYLYFKYNNTVIVLKDNPIIKSFMNEYEVVPDFDKREGYDDLIGNVGIASYDSDELSRIEYNLVKEFGDVLDVYLSSETTINIVPKIVSKRIAIEDVCEILNLNDEEIATIGDSPNDISMLSGFKNSFAMSHAREDVINSATYKVKSVAEALNFMEQI